MLKSIFLPIFNLITHILVFAPLLISFPVYLLHEYVNNPFTYEQLVTELEALRAYAKSRRGESNAK